MRLNLSLSMVAFAATILYSHYMEAIFPVLPIGMIVAVGAILFAVLRRPAINRQTAFVILSVLISLSMLYKSYIFMFPASLIGFDPGLYVQQVQLLIDANRLWAIDETEIGFYAKAPLFILLVTIFRFIGGTTAETAMVVYPVLIGIIYPIAAFSLARRIAPTDSLRTAVIAAAVATVGALSLQYGFHPIGQTLAVALWIAFLLVLIRYYIRRTRVDFLLTGLILLALLYTHKVPGIVVGGTVLALLTIDILMRSLGDPQALRGQKLTPTLFLFISIAVFMQWAFLTEFIKRVLIRGTVLLSPKFLSGLLERMSAVFGGSGGGTAGGSVPNAVINPLLVLLMNNLYAVFLFPLAAIAWAVLFVRRRGNPSTRVILASSAFIMFIVVLGYIRRIVVNPRRFTFFAEILLIVLVAAAIGWLFAIIGHRLPAVKTPVVLALLIVLLAAQSFSVPALPNHPIGSREYFTTTEMQGKRFAQEYTSGNIYTDFFYANKPPSNPAEVGQPEKYVSMDEELLWRSKNLSAHNYVIFRKYVEVYRTPGKSWRLTWNAQRWLGRKYSQVYSNGGVIMYARTRNTSRSN